MDQKFPARIRVKIHNEVGALAQVTQVIGEAGADIDELQMTTQVGARIFSISRSSWKSTTSRTSTR